MTSFRPFNRRNRSRQGSGSGLLGAVERAVGITSTGLLLLGLTSVGWLTGRKLASRPVLVLVYGLILLIAFGWILARRRVAIIVGRSKVPTRVRVGQQVDIELTLSSRRRVSSIVLEESLPPEFGEAKRFPLTALPADQEINRAYSFVPTRRGKYLVGPLLAEWSDPFGLVRRRAVMDESVPIIVHPSTELVHDRVVSRAWEDPPIRPPVSKPWATGFEFYGMRDYVNGDDPRRIVWRATARTLDLESGTGRYFVREAEQGITDKVNILIDTDRGSHSPGPTSDTFELAIRAAASLGVKHLRDGFGLNLWGNHGPIASGLRGRRAILPFLDDLAGLEPGDEPLVRSLERLMVDRSGRSHNIVITPAVSRDSAKRLRLVLDAGTHVLLTLILWEDTDPATIQRAGSLGCGVVEITAGAPLERVFRQTVGGRR